MDQPLKCDHCERARGGMGAGYRMTPNRCNECVARLIARSLVMHEAVRQRDATELRETLDRMLPGIPYEAAHAMVKAWWQSDQALRNSLRPAN